MTNSYLQHILKKILSDEKKFVTLQYKVLLENYRYGQQRRITRYKGY